MSVVVKALISVKLRKSKSLLTARIQILYALLQFRVGMFVLTYDIWIKHQGILWMISDLWASVLFQIYLSQTSISLSFKWIGVICMNVQMIKRRLQFVFSNYQVSYLRVARMILVKKSLWFTRDNLLEASSAQAITTNSVITSSAETIAPRRVSVFVDIATVFLAILEMIALRNVANNLVIKNVRKLAQKAPSQIRTE